MSYGLNPSALDRLYRKAMTPRAVAARVLMIIIMLAGAALLVFGALVGRR
jgi:hypothetical protein